MSTGADRTYADFNGDARMKFHGIRSAWQGLPPEQVLTIMQS